MSRRLFELCQAVRDGSARPEDVRELAMLAESAVLFPSHNAYVPKPHEPITKEVAEKWVDAIMPEIQKAIDGAGGPESTMCITWRLEVK